MPPDTRRKANSFRALWCFAQSMKSSMVTFKSWLAQNFQGSNAVIALPASQPRGSELLASAQAAGRADPAKALSLHAHLKKQRPQLIETYWFYPEIAVKAVGWRVHEAASPVLNGMYTQLYEQGRSQGNCNNMFLIIGFTFKRDNTVREIFLIGDVAAGMVTSV